MADILVRGLSREAVERIDEQARVLGLSRNEYLRRQLEGGADRTDYQFTVTDLKRAGDAANDLLDDDVMEGAWR